MCASPSAPPPSSATPICKAELDIGFRSCATTGGANGCGDCPCARRTDGNVQTRMAVRRLETNRMRIPQHVYQAGRRLENLKQFLSLWSNGQTACANIFSDFRRNGKSPARSSLAEGIAFQESLLRTESLSGTAFEGKLAPSTCLKNSASDADALLPSAENG